MAVADRRRPGRAGPYFQGPKRLSGPLAGARRLYQISCESDGAVKKTRTSTGFRPQRPQRCASTNSAMTAKSPGGFEAAPWQERATSKGFLTRQVASANYFQKERIFLHRTEFMADLRGSADLMRVHGRIGPRHGMVKRAAHGGEQVSEILQKVQGRCGAAKEPGLTRGEPARLSRASSRSLRPMLPWECRSALR